MSIIFETDGQIRVWNPSMQIGLLYLEEVESASRIFHVPSGLEDQHCDQVIMFVDAFTTFLRHLIDAYARSAHDVFRLQLSPVILPGIVMLERAAHPVIVEEPEGLLLAESARVLGRSMAR